MGHMTETRTGAAEAASRQMTELAQAFRGFRKTVPGLRVEVVGTMNRSSQYVHPVAGFHVALDRDDGAGVSLYVSASYAELVRWLPSAGALRERFDVQLDGEVYGWNASTFQSAADLAHDLLAYMQFNLDALQMP